jgi:hypothetical protein
MMKKVKVYLIEPLISENVNRGENDKFLVSYRGMPFSTLEPYGLECIGAYLKKYLPELI